MPNSLLKSIKTNHVLYKLSITKPTKINQATYKNYNNKLNSIKRKAERDHYSNQLEINKSDMKKSWKIMKTVIGNKRKTIKKKAMYNKLIKFLVNYNILDQNQFGFRQGHSTHHALITLVDKITKSLDNGDIVIGVFIDLKMAFDTVDHKILFKKYIIMVFAEMHSNGLRVI